VGLAAVVLALLATQITPAELTRLAAEAVPGWLWAALGLYLLTQGARGWRLASLTRGAAPVWRLSAVAGLQNLLLALLPLRGGEVTFVALLSREATIGAAWASKILVAVRVLDLLVVCVLLAAVVVWPSGLPEVARLALLPAAILGLLALGILLWPGRLAQLLRPPALWLAKHPRLSRLPFAPRLQGFLDRLLQVQDTAWFRRQMPLLLAQTVLVWLLVLATNYACLQSLGLTVSPAAITYLTVLLVLSGILPIHGWGGFGPQDAIGAGLLLTLGYERPTAIAAQLAWHAELVLAATIAGLLGWALLRFIPRRSLSK
jgi:hypothetical protein